VIYLLLGSKGSLRTLRSFMTNVPPSSILRRGVSKSVTTGGKTAVLDVIGFLYH
jgi:hypothetical protein